MFIAADWPAPAQVHACVSTRHGGCSAAPRDSLNLAQHVGDDPAAVARNRRILAAALGLPAEPAWLDQVHGCAVVEARCDGIVRTGDAAYTSAPGVVCAVMTADCLPVLLTDRAGTQVAAVHCGWRGLAAGVLAATVARFACPGTELIAWLGPAISQRAFEVGPEVRAAFLAPCRDEPSRAAVRAAFLPAHDGAPRLPRRPLRAGADRARRARREPRLRRRILHLRLAGALLFLPPRRRHRPHGQPDLDFSRSRRRLNCGGLPQDKVATRGTRESRHLQRNRHANGPFDQPAPGRAGRRAIARRRSRPQLHHARAPAARAARAAGRHRASAAAAVRRGRQGAAPAHRRAARPAALRRGHGRRGARLQRAHQAAEPERQARAAAQGQVHLQRAGAAGGAARTAAVWARR